MADVFEEFSRRVSDVASDITKKTGDTLEIQKIKSNVRTLKRANERDLADIGRMVYEKFQSGEVSDMDYVTLCEEIEKREEEILQISDVWYMKNSRVEKCQTWIM